MMMPLSIQTRLNLLFGALLLLALATNVLVIVWSAGPRIRAEDTSIMTLTRQTVARALAEIREAPDPAQGVARLLNRLSDVRHARVYLEPPPHAGKDTFQPQLSAKAEHDTDVPAWFSRLLTYDRFPVRVPVMHDDTLFGTIVIASNPADEISEIWDSVTGTLTGGVALIAAVFALTSLAVRHALMPINNLSSALTAMERGNYAVELATTGPPELASISAKVNDLAAALTRSRQENSRLAEQMITLEDQERRELARELHDEFGPYLFAIRATISSLMARASADQKNPLGQDVTRMCTQTLDHVSALQQLNRRVLQRLRPPALTELGLEGALTGLVALWRENNPALQIALKTDIHACPLDDTTQLTVYRVVQEGLTNALRHASATAIDVAVSVDPTHRVCITVADNGGGMESDRKPGFGLSGMSERVWALGGTLTAGNKSAAEGGPRGFIVNVVLPVTKGGARA